MDTIVRALSIYFFLLLILRLSGRRTLGEMTAFDLILLLIISETTQQALLGDDFSITNAALLITALVGIDIAMSHVKSRLPRLERVIDGVPMIIVEHGRPLAERLRWSRVDESDILAAARKLRGVERMDQIRYAVLEADGAITIVPQR